MASLLFFTTAHSLSHPLLHASTSAISATLSLRVQNRFRPSLFIGLQSHASFSPKRRGFAIVKVIDSTGSESAIPPPEPKKEVVPVENLPLESKLKLMQEQKLKMKLAKKIRLRRKRLVRKRHLRKKGRWPPSKMKKNKNV